MNMPTQRETVSTAELVAALGALGPADLARLNMLAKVRARYCPGLDWRDLLHDAVDRALDGSRSWPRGLPLLFFLRETMRSLASEYRRKYVDGLIRNECDLPAAADGQSPLLSVVSESPGIEQDLSARQTLASILKMFDGDDQALIILDAMARDASPDEIQRAGHMSPTQYASAQKRIRRGLARAYPEGMPQ
ncbi:MAG: hypothetical protein ABL931_21335 [Usitatibacteraceae bacterium]